jgi:membrane protein DedA with SNARE-associated domain
MIDVLHDHITGLPWPALCAIAAALAFLESAALLGLVVPGETGVVVCAALGSAAGAPLVVFLAVAVVAIVAGELVAFGAGQRWGWRIRRSALGRRLGEHRWQRADRLLHRRGTRAVVLGRFVPVAQALLPLLAGGSGMSRRRFLGSSALGAVLWASVYVNAGFLAGASAERAGASIALIAGIAVIAITVVPPVARRLAGSTAVRQSQETVDADDAPMSIRHPIRDFRQHHHHSHEAASHAVEEFFENLIFLLGFPGAAPAPVRASRRRLDQHAPRRAN